VAGLEPTLPLRLQAIWGLGSSQVGLVFIAAVVPTLICEKTNIIPPDFADCPCQAAPIAGWWADKKGAEWITVICLGLAFPWWFLLLLGKSFAFFVAVFAIESKPVPSRCMKRMANAQLRLLQRGTRRSIDNGACFSCKVHSECRMHVYLLLRINNGLNILQMPMFTEHSIWPMASVPQLARS
jgi:hypothetical protein